MTTSCRGAPGSSAPSSRLADHVAAACPGRTPGRRGSARPGCKRDQRPAPHRRSQHRPGMRPRSRRRVADQLPEDHPGLPGPPHALLGGDQPGQHRRRVERLAALAEPPDRRVDRLVRRRREAVLSGQDLDDSSAAVRESSPSRGRPSRRAVDVRGPARRERGAPVQSSSRLLLRSGPSSSTTSARSARRLEILGPSSAPDVGDVRRDDRRQPRRPACVSEFAEVVHVPFRQPHRPEVVEGSSPAVAIRLELQRVRGGRGDDAAELRGRGDGDQALVAAADGALGGVPDRPRFPGADRPGEDQVLAVPAARPSAHPARSGVQVAGSLEHCGPLRRAGSRSALRGVQPATIAAASASVISGFSLGRRPHRTGHRTRRRGRAGCRSLPAACGARRPPPCGAGRTGPAIWAST